jgi:nucleoside phosphorylase
MTTLPERRRFDVGLVVPLNEELRHITAVAPLVETLGFDGTYYYVLDFGQTSVVCCLVANMGPLPALHATARLLNFAEVRLLVVLGLAGALDPDVSVGDIVVASEVNEFQANSKAEATGDDSFELIYSGRHFPLDFRIREAISHFEFSGRVSFGLWQKDTVAHFARVEVINKHSVCTAPAKVHLGPVASGNTVAAASAFVKELKRIDRKFLGIDMEAAGAALAATDRILPIPCLVVRGISDPANETKAKLEKTSKGAWRGYCVRNAASFLRRLLEWEGFRVASGLSLVASAVDPFAVVKELATRLGSRVGGTWLVAVMYDIYSHGPLLDENARVGAADITRATRSDLTLNDLVVEVLDVRDQLARDSDADAAERRIISALETYRTKHTSVETNALLSAFDKVASELIFPHSEDDEVRLQLLEADKVEELEGVEGLISFLRGIKPHTSQTRERYIDALERLSLWPDIVAEQEGLDPRLLGRSGLEHCIYACAHTGVEGRARQLFEFHRETFVDPAGALFRSHAIQRFALLIGSVRKES